MHTTTPNVPLLSFVRRDKKIKWKRSSHTARLPAKLAQNWKTNSQYCFSFGEFTYTGEKGSPGKGWISYRDMQKFARTFQFFPQITELSFEFLWNPIRNAHYIVFFLSGRKRKGERHVSSCGFHPVWVCICINIEFRNGVCAFVCFFSVMYTIVYRWGDMRLLLNWIEFDIFISRVVILHDSNFDRTMWILFTKDIYVSFFKLII